MSVLGIESHVFKSHYFDGKMTERFIVIDCKSIGFNPIVGSNPTLFNYCYIFKAI